MIDGQPSVQRIQVNTSSIPIAVIVLQAYFVQNNKAVTQNTKLNNILDLPLQRMFNFGHA